MSEFNVVHRYFLNITIDDGPTVTIQIDVNTDGELRVRPVGHLHENQSLYLYLGKERRRK